MRRVSSAQAAVAIVTEWSGGGVMVDMVNALARSCVVTGSWTAPGLKGLCLGRAAEVNRVASDGRVRPHEPFLESGQREGLLPTRR